MRKLNQYFNRMKTTKKQPKIRVSDRAYCVIISDVIDSLTGCRIDPFTFKQVVTAVSSYLKPEGKIIGLSKKAKMIFDRLLPDLDRAVLRSAKAKAAAARRKAAAKESVRTEITETIAQPEATEEGKSENQTENQIDINTGSDVTGRVEITAANIASPKPRRIRGSRCPGFLPYD